MNSQNEPVAQLSDEDIAAIKEDLHESSLIIKEDIKNDPEYDGEADVILEVIENLENDLKGVRTYSDLGGEKWNKVFMNMSALHDMLEEIYADEEFADEDFDDDLGIRLEPQDDEEEKK